MPEDDVAVLDEGVLGEVLETTGNDIGFVRELVETYLADTPAQLEAMTAAVEADDAASLVRPAHTLKSSSASVGAMRLAAAARELEMAGRSEALGPSVPAALEGARAEWRAVSDAFAAWLDRTAAE
jgi:HPt (histidine-containing phosphotransfer) domain-containing protein